MKKTKNKVDLHVHSPASEDFKGNKGRAGFVSLIEAYKKADISTIAITDHNTILGFKEYVRIKKETKLNYELNATREDATDLLNKLKEEISCFSSVNVLPGVEVSVYGGIHLSLIFDEEISIDEVETFLRFDLGLGDAVDKGAPDRLCQETPISIFNKATSKFGNKYFAYLPHVDSSKGVWKETEGATRADIVKNPNVIAAQIVNPESIKHIEDTLRNPTYKREYPLGLFQASDYHGDPSTQPAGQHIVVDSDEKISFLWLKNNLFKKNKYKNSFEFMEENYKEFIEGKLILECEFKDKLLLEEKIDSEFIAKICAFINTENTLLQFNLLNIRGDVKNNIDEVAKVIKSVTEKLDPPEMISFKIFNYSLSENRQRLLVEIKNNHKIRLFEDKVYVAGMDSIRPAKSWEIERIISQLSFNRYGKAKQKVLKNTSTKLLMISSSLSSIPIAVRIEQFVTYKLYKDLELIRIKPTYPLELKPIQHTNGTVKGDYYYLASDNILKAGRLIQQDYYRFSLPTHKKPSSLQNLPESELLKANSLVVFSDGGVNYAEYESIIYSPFQLYKFSFKESSINNELLLGLCSYLKSSFVLWYSCMINETDDLFLSLLRGQKLPLPIDKNLLISLAPHAKNIIIEEKKILKILEGYTNDYEKNEQRDKQIEQHNKACLNSMKMIDKQIFQHLKMTSDEIFEIYGSIKELDLFDYDISKDLEAFVKEVNSK